MYLSISMNLYAYFIHVNEYIYMCINVSKWEESKGDNDEREGTYAYICP